MTSLVFRALAAFLFAFVDVFPTSGQDVDTAKAAVLYPYNDQIEQEFSKGIRAWDRAAYDSALTYFQAIIKAPENRRTTAAMLMAGRTLLVSERYAEAVGLLSAFVDRYPESRYVKPAKETLKLARERYELQRKREEGDFVLGVLLPMNERAVRFTRSMFTGIRMAVDRFNSKGGRQIRIVFEDSGASPDKAQAAFNSLIGRSNPGAIIGPLFSEEAIAVAQLADSAGVPLLVPLATDGAVAEERSYVFQANPSYEMRGRIMARYAVQRLRHGKLGVIADSTSYAGRMAEGFAAEAAELDADVSVALIGALSDWYSIAERMAQQDDRDRGALNLLDVDAVYLPVTGDNASGLATVALDEIDIVDPRLPLLGNGEWAHVPEQERMAAHTMTYASDFRVDSTRSDVLDFDRQFRLRMNRAPDQLAFVGFDVASFLTDRLRSTGPDDSLVEAFHDSGEFKGYGIRIFFADGQVNRSLFFSRYTAGGLRQD